MRVAIVTDAWRPQINGVVTTLARTGECLASFGHEVRFLGPDSFRTVPCPTYPEIRLSLFPKRRLQDWIDDFDPEAVHIATEGSLGLSARKAMVRRTMRFTTSYHTRFPQYVRARIPLPVSWSYRLLRWFHGRADRVMVNTERVRQELAARGFPNLVHWGRGVDTGLFRPGDKSFLDLPRPVFVYAGRVAVEKNIEAFLSLDLPGTRLVVGDGPAMRDMQERHPDVVYTGYRFGADLAATLAAADVFVFPSRTDTFGLVMLEAMACGLPVAAFPVTGPVDVVRNGVTGVLHEDLRAAALEALDLDPAACRAQALGHTWEIATRQFESNLVEARGRLSRKAQTPVIPARTPEERHR